MNKTDYKDMWVYIEHDGGKVLPVSLELCCETRKLCDAAGEKLCAVIVGELHRSELEKVMDCGVEKLIRVSGTGYERFSVDAYTELFTRLCRKYKPSAVLVGGKMMAVITVPFVRPQVGTIRPGTFKYQPAGPRPCELIEERIDFPVEKIRTKVLDFLPDEEDESLNIADAEYIVCVGNGLKGADALGRYRELAALLGGKLGCTRPVFDRGVLPYKLVIGQSGVVVKPKVYIAFGVSGAVNHVTGITDSDVIVAVNRDPEAAIFGYCSYGIVGDMDEVCDAMIAQLKGRA